METTVECQTQNKMEELKAEITKTVEGRIKEVKQHNVQMKEEICEI